MLGGASAVGERLDVGRARHDPFRRIPGLAYVLLVADRPEDVSERIPELLRLVVPFDEVYLEAPDAETLRAALAGEAALPPRGGPMPNRLVLRLPLVAHRIELGSLVVGRRATPFAADEVDALESFAGLAALALHGAHVRVELRRLAYTDALTGLGNRRALEAELVRVDGLTPLSLLLLDFDGLKAANDALGYAAGDRLIVESARVLASALRPGELAARLGGDEFVAVLPGVEEADALRRGAEIAAAVDAVPFPPELAALFQGASCGAVGAQTGERPADLLLRAARDMNARKAARKLARAVGTPLAQMSDAQHP
jgi:diguanylate cyclase (GGDEF)-like protein